MGRSEVYNALVKYGIEEGMEVMAIPETDMTEMSGAIDRTETENDTSVGTENSIESE